MHFQKGEGPLKTVKTSQNFVDSSSAGTQLIVCMRRSRVGGDGDAGRRAEEGEDAVRMRGRARDGALLRTQPDHIQRYIFLKSVLTL